MYQCGRCGLIRASGQEMGVIQQCKCPWEFTPPVMQQAQQRTWVGLTDEDLAVCGDEDDVMLARYWERVLKEKNNA